jgi:ABC-type nitrate/sulfonate/bicarbonate transport system substrate-binding protein
MRRNNLDDGAFSMRRRDGSQYCRYSSSVMTAIRRDSDSSRRDFIYGALATAIAAIMTSCSPSDSTRADKNHLNLQAAWINDAEFMGYFVALDNGYYKAEGIHFDFLAGGPDVIPESRLISGKADVALTTIETTVRAIADQGAKFKIIGTQFQKSPLGVVSLASSNIRRPEDLIGKTFACPPVNLVTIKSILSMHNIPEASVRIVPYQYDPTPLLDGNIDASIDFCDDVPFTIERAGKQPSYFLLYDAGFTIGNDFVVASEETIAKKRRALVKFLRASRKGWDENFANVEAYPPKFSDTWFKGTGRAVENETFFNAAQKSLIQTPGGIFSMSEEWIAKNIEALQRVGIKATRQMFDTSLLAEV